VRQANCLPNLVFVSRGKSRGNPGDLFVGQAFEQLLSRWRQEFDYVLIDSCPVFVADDATTLAAQVDGTLLVVRHRVSRARAVRQALELLCQRQAKVLGLVFNGASASSQSYQSCYRAHAEYYGREDER
jgi:Mrp family chromosome partitioning ATPase